MSREVRRLKATRAPELARTVAIAPLVGLRAAWRCRDTIESNDIRALIPAGRPVEGANEWRSVETPGPLERAAARLALRTSGLSLRILSRLGRGAWRTSCLYRSVAGAQALRALGLPADVRIGVGRTGSEGAHTGGIQAHAWIDSPALPEHPPADWTPLRTSEPAR